MIIRAYNRNINCKFGDMDYSLRYFITCFVISCWLLESGGQERKVCIGTSNGMSHEINGNRYSNYSNHYRGCNVVDGNLEVVFLGNGSASYDMSFLKDIEEVTGYVLIFSVNARIIPLTSLRIIRGKTLFQSGSGTPAYGLYVAYNYMNETNVGLRELQLKSLTEISRGSVFIQKNQLLCHIDTIDWTQILDGNQAIASIQSNGEQCTTCSSNCEEGCWSADPNMCQILTKSCSSQCGRDRCSGQNPGECCHSECAAGCTGPKEWHCHACRNYKDSDKCVAQCPPPKIYNPETEKLEINPDAKYIYRSQCVRKCPPHMAVEQGACVAVCAEGGRPGPDGRCVSCNGPCPISCSGTGESDWLHVGNIDGFRDCVTVQGSIKIQQTTFTGDAYRGFRGLTPDELSVLEDIEEITGYLLVDANLANFTSLSFLRNLRVIQGQRLYGGESSLRIYRSSLETLGLNSLREIRNGKVFVKNNPRLCLADSFNWNWIFFDTSNGGQTAILEDNRNSTHCEEDGMVCSEECTSDGCMGADINQCLECSNFRFGETCLMECSIQFGGIPLYQVNGTHCAQCDEECFGSCSGPGNDQCLTCAHVKAGAQCLRQCPPSQYPDEAGLCTDCSDLCLEGCTGPGESLGPGACNSCALTLLDSDGRTVLRCLPDGTLCPNFRPPDGKKDHLSGIKGTCQPCPHYEERNNCVERCSTHTYGSGKQCMDCHPLCLNCSGPTADECQSCAQLKVYEVFDERLTGSKFNCSAECPDWTPNRIVEDHETICAPDEYVDPDKQRQVAIIVGVLTSGCLVLGLVAILILLLRRQVAKTEEKKLRLTAKLTGIVECEPLTPSNTKPDMAVLRLIKESDLRRRNVIGSGAFGTVYKGFWVPEGDNVKIPVAIKVLQDGCGQSESLLEEARIMASVDHPCCVRILAACMTAEMMLVTQLMPLGCLLDYVRKNKDNVGSKAILNWATQIARGMDYLEERGIIHRDLAARNVLVQTPHHVKITDFGLAKVVSNGGQFQASGGKWPIKWLALECIQHQIFTHKSDVWSFGVTIWELCTYGQRPYERINARDVIDLLEKGERLPQPSICTIDVYMIMIKCWILEADSRPSFAELSEEFAKMARDPARYLVVQNDSSMQLTSHPVTTKELLKFMSLDSTEGTEGVISGDDYINNINRRKTNKAENISSKSTSADPLCASSSSQKHDPNPALRLNIPRRSGTIGLSDNGPESPRYSPEPSSLNQPLPFQRPRTANRPDSASTEPQSLFRRQSSGYLKPAESSPPATYLELVSESDAGHEQPEIGDKATEADQDGGPDDDKDPELPPTITVTNPEYFNQSSALCQS